MQLREILLGVPWNLLQGSIDCLWGGCQFQGANFKPPLPLDERQITHLICARLKYDLYDFFRGFFGAFHTRKRKEAGPKHPLKKSYRSYFRRAQIRWILWRSSNHPHRNSYKWKNKSQDLDFSLCGIMKAKAKAKENLLDFDKLVPKFVSVACCCGLRVPNMTWGSESKTKSSDFHL